jgi:hypothetical protein
MRCPEQSSSSSLRLIQIPIKSNVLKLLIGLNYSTIDLQVYY